MAENLDLEAFESSFSSPAEAKVASQRMEAATGAAGDYWNAEPPIPRSIFPSVLKHDSPEIKSVDPMSSIDVMAELEALGDTLMEVDLNYYRPNTYVGTPRRLDNADCLKGKENIYGTIDKFESIYKRLKIAVQKYSDMIHRDCDAGSIIASMEKQDDKLTMQQWRMPGYFLESPIAKRPEILTAPTSEGLKWATFVAKTYGAVLKRIPEGKMSLEQLTLADSDPQTTMTGMPTLKSGDMSHAARLAVLKALPPTIGVTPQEWIDRMKELASALGFTDPMFYSPVLATRFGPRDKPFRLWKYQGPGMGYVSDHEALAVYNRVRAVYPSPYYLNFILSPVYEQCSHVRRAILGLWHDPDSQAAYLPKLRAQGKYCYSVDFSGMDTGMYPHIIDLFLQLLIDNGFARWPLEVFKTLYKDMGLLLPSYLGSKGMATLVTGPARPWASGFKLTSEMDTLYGASVLLTVLEQQIPGIAEKWRKGEFTFLELGDDIFFTIDTPIDPHKLHDDALSHWGADLEIIEDAMFLKWFLPVHPDVPCLMRSVNRFIQQTFFNEDSYTGIKGGTTPDCIMRMALKARMNGLAGNPYWEFCKKEILPLVREFEYLKTADPEYLAGLDSANPPISQRDVQDILDYSLKSPDYLANLTERAKYEMSAAKLLEELKQMGITDGETPGDIGIRTQYWKALQTPPSAADIEVLRSLTDPIIAPIASY